MPETAQDLSQGMYKIKAAVNSPSPMKKHLKIKTKCIKSLEKR